jgi:hypothetical protein
VRRFDQGKSRPTLQKILVEMVTKPVLESGIQAMLPRDEGAPGNMDIGVCSVLICLGKAAPFYSAKLFVLSLAEGVCKGLCS